MYRREYMNRYRPRPKVKGRLIHEAKNRKPVTKPLTTPLDSTILSSNEKSTTTRTTKIQPSRVSRNTRDTVASDKKTNRRRKTIKRRTARTYSKNRESAPLPSGVVA